MITLVITSIQKSPMLHQLRTGPFPTIIIGDRKGSPGNWDLGRQSRLPFKLARICRENSYTRKNLGYLIANQAGTDVIVETDDDTVAYPEFWEDRLETHTAHVVAPVHDWVNVWQYFTDELIWPRGFPLKSAKGDVPPTARGTVVCPIQQGLIEGDPDVDAVYRLIHKPTDFWFKQNESVILRWSWCPFNSQNTTWFKRAFPLMYLPTHCTFRMTDIWRSLVAQRICWEQGWGVLHHKATIRQERNPHELLLDFKYEVDGHLKNENIASVLDDLDLTGDLKDDLLASYKELVRLEVFPPEELPLVEAWLEDIG